MIKACIEAGTHYVDISGEALFIEEMQLKYHEAAKAKGVYVISACGFDSIPNELGAVHFERKFEGQVNSLESYLQISVDGGFFGCEGALVNYGTWKSAIRSFSRRDDLAKLRKGLKETPIPEVKPELENRLVIYIYFY